MSPLVWGLGRIKGGASSSATRLLARQIWNWNSFGPGSSLISGDLTSGGRGGFGMWHQLKNGSLSEEQKLHKFALLRPLKPQLGSVWTE